ncbi:MAG: Glycerol-3-phosphate dehydrogenase, partial [uncultured Nocardioides sp.]
DDHPRSGRARQRPGGARGDRSGGPRRRAGGGWRDRRRRGRPGRGHPRALGGAAGAARPRLRHLLALLQARARRAALPRDAGLRPGQGGAGGARAAAHPAGAAPGAARAVPLPARARLGAAVRRGRRRPLRRDGDDRQVRHGRPQAQARLPQAARPDGARHQDRRPARGHPLLRLPGRRRPAGDDDRADGRQQRRPRRDPHQGDGVPPRRRPGGRGAGPRPGEPAGLRGPRQDGHQRRGRVDRRGPGDARRPRPARRRREQGRPPGRLARPHPLGVRLHHQDGQVGALRDPVGPLLGHRHHRHAVGPRPGTPRRQPGGHRLPAPPREPAAQGSSRPPRRHRCLGRTAAAAQGRRQAGGGQRRRDDEAVARAHRRQPGAGAGAGRRRQADDVPRDGARRGRPRRPRLGPRSGQHHRAGAVDGGVRLRGAHQPAGRAQQVVRPGGRRRRPPARTVRRPRRRGARARRAPARAGPAPARRGGLPLGGDRLRRDPRGGAPPRRRADPPYAHLDRDVRPRDVGGPACGGADGRRAGVGRRHHRRGGGPLPPTRGGRAAEPADAHRPGGRRGAGQRAGHRPRL